jgi:hypothetical protein
LRCCKRPGKAFVASPPDLGFRVGQTTILPVRSWEGTFLTFLWEGTFLTFLTFRGKFGKLAASPTAYKVNR